MAENELECKQMKGWREGTSEKLLRAIQGKRRKQEENEEEEEDEN